MANQDSKNGIDQFQDAAQTSGHIFSTWLHRCGVERRMIREELKTAGDNLWGIGEKSFKQWTSDGESAKRVSGSTPEMRGDRLVAMIHWFAREHTHRSRPVIFTEELRQLLSVYPDLPVKHRLQIKRIIHDLEIQNGEREANFTFAKDWRNHFSDWPVFCFVLDRYWTVRASTCYEMALAGYQEEDMQHWSWWHRLTASHRGKPKYILNSPRYSLRGPYSDAYYCQQLQKFRAATASFQVDEDARYRSLMELLQSTSRFQEMWNRICFSDDSASSPSSSGTPVPFFRLDGTLLWMLEVSATIPNTPGYQLIVWVPLNDDSAEYQAEIRRWADEQGRYSRKAYFIEEFRDCFDEHQRFALGVD